MTGFFVVLTYIRIVIVIQWYNPILFIAYVFPVVKRISCTVTSAVHAYVPRLILYL